MENSKNNQNNQNSPNHLANAAVVGENPTSAFLADGQHLHAVEALIANQKKEQSDVKKVLPLMREALKALIQYAQGKVEAHFLAVDWTELAKKSNEQAELIHKIQSIYSHLPHHDRNELSSMIHHKQETTQKS